MFFKIVVNMSFILVIMLIKILICLFVSERIGIFIRYLVCVVLLGVVFMIYNMFCV